MRTGNPGHLASFDYLGPHRYFLTFCTHQRAKLFTSADRVKLTHEQILRSAREQSGAIAAYCFMPDHLHLLIEMESESSDCLRFISRAKQFSGFHFERAFGIRLWQRYGYERVLRDDENSLLVARYILANPVRAALAARSEDYEFLGSEKYSVREILDAVQMTST